MELGIEQIENEYFEEEILTDTLQNLDCDCPCCKFIPHKPDDENTIQKQFKFMVMEKAEKTIFSKRMVQFLFVAKYMQHKI